ncbi:hypothetical protein GY45DRAFT_1335536 [Cubamyces sp. BRFM 1775]|nr:hypothetical protein GY45DRAFT_1335536 [Cubamyces sp. BRFM 1775]
MITFAALVVAPSRPRRSGRINGEFSAATFSQTWKIRSPRARDFLQIVRVNHVVNPLPSSTAHGSIVGIVATRSVLCPQQQRRLEFEYRLPRTAGVRAFRRRIMANYRSNMCILRYSPRATLKLCTRDKTSAAALVQSAYLVLFGLLQQEFKADAYLRSWHLHDAILCCVAQLAAAMPQPAAY